MRHAPLFLAFAACSFSCSTVPAGSGALKVVVTLEAGLSSRCARVVARGTRERESTAVTLAEKTSFTVGIAQEGEPADVELQALGYSDEACTVLTTPAERSAPLAARFASPVAEVALTLARDPANQADGGADLDRDGFTADDCDDGNAAINPGASESCTNGLDDDCDKAIDCAQASCAMQACRAGSGNACVNQRCAELACNDTLDNDGDSTTDCADSDCAGQPCGTGGTCSTAGACVAPRETGLCFDGADNDADGDIDCADADCPMGSTCSDSNACTMDDVCGSAGQGCIPGAQVVCMTPPAGCFAAVGMCAPGGGGCTYEVVSGSCADNLFCTLNDTCLGDGGCAGTPRVCDAPPSACHAATGTCLESSMGACSYAPLPSGACDDSDNCTVGDSCDGDGGCAGTRVTCTPPSECLTAASTCLADGGCIFTPRAGSCDGGTCNAAGTCVTTPTFSYTPSNFTEGQLPALGPAVVANCNVTIDTRTADGGVSWTTCPTGPAAPPHTLIPVGTNTAVLFFMESLTINGSTELEASGERPLILAVKNAVTINGRIDVGSVGTRGAGSDIDCAAGAGADGGVSGIPETAGGGGGGGFLSNGTAGTAGENGGAAGARGSSNGNTTLVPLRGGCRGGNGGRFTSTSGVGGRGGGAVQVSSGAAITVNSSGTIAASGEGGKGGLYDQRIGGGGGGTGGAILLEGTTITVNSLGALVANGGAGGEGSGYGGAAWSGVDGQSGQRSELRAECFDVGACGGNGGSGGATAGNPTAATNPSCGTNMPGGGGGGSAGRIRLNAVTGCTLNGTAVISPTPTGTGSNCP